MYEANQKRAIRFELALMAYSEGSYDTQLIDILTDAMHWAEANSQVFHYAFAQACRHYVHELDDQQNDETRPIP